MSTEQTCVKKKVATVKCVRSKGGITLYVQGDPDAFTLLRSREYGDCISLRGVDGMIEVYRPRTAILTGVEATFRTDSALMVSEFPNLIFLLAKNLAEGVTFEIDGLVSSQRVHEFCTLLQTAIGQLYRQYLAPLNSTVEITVATREEIE